MSAMQDTQEAEAEHSKLEILFGNKDTHPLENRVFNTASILVALAGIATLLMNYFAGNPTREVIISAIATFIGLASYILSIKFQKDQYLRIPMILLLLGVLITIWITNQGSQGSTPLFFTVLFVVGAILLAPPYDTLVLGASFLVVIGLLTTEQIYPSIIIPYLSDSHRFLDVAISLMICLIITTILVRLVVKEYQAERARNEVLYKQAIKDKLALEKAFTEIKVLQGILPVCSFCKKIRDEHSEWHAIEHYISDHSEARFSHGFCPDCAKEHYSDFIDKYSKN